MQLEIPRTGTTYACPESRCGIESIFSERGPFADAIGGDDQPSSGGQLPCGNLRKFPTRKTGRWWPVLNNPCALFLMTGFPTNINLRSRIYKRQSTRLYKNLRRLSARVNRQAGRLPHAL